MPLVVLGVAHAPLLDGCEGVLHSVGLHRSKLDVDHENPFVWRIDHPSYHSPLLHP